MNDTTSAVNNGYSQTFGKGLRVLAALRAHQDGLTVGTIATEVGVHRTVVYRLLGTLRAHGLITQQSDGRFRLGLGLIELAGGVRSTLREAAHPHLVTLADEVTATAFLTLADGDEAVSANVVPPRNSKLHVGYRAGLRHPLEVSAAGVAILATRAPQPHERTAVTNARERGYAVTTSELEPGAWGLAATLPGPIAASIGVVALTELDETTVAKAVLRTTQTIAATLTS